MTNRKALAEELFYKGYNCSQSVLLAYSDMTGLDEKTAAMISSSFGGGIGRMREVCGAVSGGAMVLGLIKGYSDPSDRKAKAEHYALIRDFAGRFKTENGSYICRELLEGTGAGEGGTPQERTPEFYKKRPCARLISSACGIIDEMLGE